MKTSRVSGVTSESSPPMTPAMATAFFSSAMTSMSGVRATSLPSSVRIVSPFFARRMRIRGPAIRDRSKVWMGWRRGEQDVVRDVDDVVDGLEAHGLDARPEPIGRRPRS